MADGEHAQKPRHKLRALQWLRLVLPLLLLFPILVLLLLPGGRLLAGVLWFWILLLLSLWALWLVLGRPGRKTRAAAAAAQPEQHILADQPELIRDVMDVKVAVEQSGVQIFRGPLREPASIAYQKLKQALGSQFVPLIHEDDQLGAAILVMPKPIEHAVLERPSRTWVNWLLFLLTLLTATWAGAANQGVNLLQDPGRFAIGLPYSLGLLTILGVHELGHFFAARYHGMNVTPPYFIPAPFALGTFGAFIRMRSPAEDRRSLFDVAVAGPLAGLVIAIPALLIGLHSSTVVPGAAAVSPDPLNGASAGSSILFALLAKISLGPALLQGSILHLSPLAFAGWLGLFITALNLLPIGQLDGGHIARSMFGTRVGRTISTVAMWSLFLLALFFWPGLMMWAIIVFFIAGQSTPPLNDLTPITPGRHWLGWFSFAILALILIPLPHAWWSVLGIYLP